ncbi:MAG: 50S ribosome-binding GTPase [Planctomycetota bacterium]|nr:50S ribosome-binding GTPase [Planctomycetota bacterium]MDA1113038.1 50S ribosome-binding GTPase [Planctomycetota bacterium]
MSSPELDVIVAPATPRGPAPRAVLRLSGIGLLDQAKAYLPPDAAVVSSARGVVETTCEILPGVPVDMFLLCFPGPASATGEDVLEIHLPGCQPVVDALLESIVKRGARLAEPGEFTRRAFLRGRLDLTQAEAVLELVESRSKVGAVSAARLLSGSLGAPLSRCRDVLLAALVELEAGLDFEEGDSQDLEPGEVGQYLTHAIAALRDGLASEEKRQVRHGGQFRIGLLGPANAGKSSLFQTLTGKRSLISEHAGTTRDRREASWQIPELELPITLIDFPGLGGSSVDAHDHAARELAESTDAALDLVWLCLPADADPLTLPTQIPEAPAVLIWTQADRFSAPVASDLKQVVERRIGRTAELRLSTATGLGLDQLQAATVDAFHQTEEAQSLALRHSERHQQALRTAIVALEQGQQWDEMGGHQDLVAEDIRNALHTLAELVGESTPEDLLDRLFSSFCVGK